ncbi:helix-turn-helix domain-containing protein [Nocardia sp. NPDC003963]
MDDRITRLGAAVKDRRLQMGYTQQDVARAGGPSDTTQTGIELGTATGVSAATLRKLDMALRWQPGSAKTVMDGGAPAALDEPTEYQTAGGRIDNLAFLTARITQLSADINALARKDPALHEIAAQVDELAGFAANASLNELTGAGMPARRSGPGYGSAADRTSAPRVEPEEDEHIEGMAARKGRSKKG